MMRFIALTTHDPGTVAAQNTGSSRKTIRRYRYAGAEGRIDAVAEGVRLNAARHGRTGTAG